MHDPATLDVAGIVSNLSLGSNQTSDRRTVKVTACRLILKPGPVQRLDAVI